MGVIEADGEAFEVSQFCEGECCAVLEFPAGYFQIAQSVGVFFYYICDSEVLVLEDTAFFLAFILWEEELDAVEAGAGGCCFHEGYHAGEAGVEDAEAEGGEGGGLD